MSVLGGSDSTTKQNLNYSPQAASDQAVVIRTGANGTLGNRNANNTNIRVARGGTYAPQITYTSDSGLREEFDAWRRDVNAALARPPDPPAAPTISDAVTDRIAGQIADAPADAAKSKRNILIIIGAALAIAALALFFGRKK